MKFPPCYVISCPESSSPPNRREIVSAHLAEHGVPFEFFRGIHGKSWSLETRKWHHRDAEARQVLLDGCRQVLNLGAAGYPDTELVEELHRRSIPGWKNAYRIDPGHIGLCLTHWMLWSMAWHAGHEEVLVCEDDVLLRPGFLGKFEEQRAGLPGGWDVWYAGSLTTASACAQEVASGLYSCYAEVPFGTHCMLIRRKALPVLMENCNEAFTHVDQLIALRALPKLNWFLSSPTLATQRSASGEWEHAVGG